MTTKLIIVRHGNTFNKGDVCTRVGARTDMPLSTSGEDQAVMLGKYLKQENIEPDFVFTSELQRTYQTAEIAFKEAGYKKIINKISIFNEVDYGPDENKTEEELLSRIGEEALKKWDESAIVPDGWIFNPKQCIENWKSFAEEVESKYKNKTIMIFTSNGIARFSPYLTGDFEKFSTEFNIKISTSALCIFEKNDNDKNWNVKNWNVKPKDNLK